ncbi:MAG: hypothetical protein R3F11_33340 [Verrucomicrobiales bacterium]
MPLSSIFQRLSQTPTNPHPAKEARQFDVADLYRGSKTAGVPSLRCAAAV